MRFLIQRPAPRHETVARGLVHALRASGHEGAVFDPSSAPAFDAFDSFGPDVYVETGERPEAVRRALEAHQRVRTVDRREIRPGFDSVLYGAGEARQDLACDVAFVGGYRPEKQALINETVLPLCRSGLKVKLFGPDPLPAPQYLGFLDDADIPDLYASARVAVNVSVGPSGERMFQILGCGCPCVSRSDGKWDGMVDMVRVAVALTPREREEVGASGCDAVMRHHTYFHRAAEMLDELGMHRDAEKVRGHA